MGFINRLFTGSSQVSQRLIDDVRRLQEAQGEATRAIAGLADRLDELHSEHRKLRGRFYAARGELEPEKRTETKAEILARIGYIPGKPAPHR